MLLTIWFRLWNQRRGARSESVWTRERWLLPLTCTSLTLARLRVVVQRLRGFPSIQKFDGAASDSL